MTSDVLLTLKSLVDQCALELILVEPGAQARLEPVHDYLTQIEALPLAVSTPLSLSEVLLTEAIGCARAWLNHRRAAGQFDAPSLQRFTAWAGWMQTACSALERDAELPPFPDTWNEPLAAPPAPTAATPSTPDEPEASLRLNLPTDAELLREFATESHEHLQNIEQGVLALEEDPANAETLNSIFRAFHTFKGVSGFLNLRPINRLAHELESLLDQARQHKLTIDAEVIDLILNGGDLLSQFITEVEAQLGSLEPPAPIAVPAAPLLVRVRSVMARTAPAGPPPPPPPAPAPVSSSPDPAAPELTADADAIPDPHASPRTPHATLLPPGATIKVDSQKLDCLLDLVGEMVIAQSMVEQDKGLSALQHQQSARNLAQLGRITRELQRVAMSLRMVPIRATFRKMTRLVRDLSLKAGKPVELVLRGEETELDRTIVEEIGDPLVHMIRNAVDHGIEPPEVRQARGKPPQGIITLRAFHRGGNIVLEMSDDGQGLDQQRILAKAREQGLVQPGESLSEKQIFNLIFAAGFSTAERVTDLSGRGVGMDVVRGNISRLGGSVSISSVPGQGTTFTICLPLTLAIIDGLIARIGDQRFVLPTLAVRESFRPTAGMIATVHHRGEMLNVRGRLLPLLRLHEHFGLEPQSTDPTQGLAIVVESDNECRCLLVDELLGKQEVVIKGLGETFKSSRSLAGAAILGDGRVGLILDISSLVKPSVHAQAA